MKKVVYTILIISMLFGTALFTACGKKESAVTIAEFEVNEGRRYTEAGELYIIPAVVAKGSDDKFYQATVVVLDPSGAEVAFEDMRFTPYTVGDYTVTYTVQVGNSTDSKGYTLECFDETEPVIEGLSPYNITGAGEVFDLSSIYITDNSRESIVPTITVKRDGEDITVENNRITINEGSVYNVHIEAEDSSGNSVSRDSIITTRFTFEDDIAPENRWYDTKISDSYAMKGNNSWEVGAFDTQINWFWDTALLGDDVGIIGNYDRVSFWVYCQSPEELNACFNILKTGGTEDEPTFDYPLEVYDNGGVRLSPDWQGKYELTTDTWYRIVGSLNDPTFPWPVATNLYDFRISLAIWDFDDIEGHPGNKICKLYLDEIRVFKSGEGDVDTEVLLQSFPVDETDKKIEHKQTFTVPVVTAVGSDGKNYKAEIYVKNPDGALVPLDANGAFKAAIVGNYTITYSVVAGGIRHNKSFNLESVVGVASFDIGKTFDRCVPGNSYEIEDVYVIGTDGKSYKAAISVLNESNEVQTLYGNTFSPTIEGSYRIIYSVPLGVSGNVTREYLLKYAEIPIITFPVDESDKTNFVGISHTVLDVNASFEGTDYDAVIAVLDPDGEAVTLNQGVFTPNKVGNYTVSYKVNIPNEGEFVKGYTYTSASRAEGYDPITGSYAVVNGTTVDNTMKLANTMRKEGYNGLSALDGAVTFNLLRGTFDGGNGTLTKYDSTTIENLDRKVATSTGSSLTADCWTSTNSFIYEVKASAPTYVEIAKYLDGTTERTITYLRQDTTIKMYVVSADGSVTEVYSATTPSDGNSTEKDAMYYPPVVYLQAGETLYYEINKTKNTSENDRKFQYLPVLKFASDEIATFAVSDNVTWFEADGEYTVQEVKAVTRAGVVLDTVISVQTEGGETISLNAGNGFTPEENEIYTITYTLDRGLRGVETRSYRLTCREPLDLVFEIDDSAKQGFMGSSHIIPNAIKAENTTGTPYTVTLSVKDSLGSNVSVVTNAGVNSFTPSAVGDYTVAYSVTVIDGGETYVITKAYTFTSVARPDDYDPSTGSYAVVDGTQELNWLSRTANALRNNGYSWIDTPNNSAKFTVLQGVYNGDPIGLLDYDASTINNLDQGKGSSATEKVWNKTNSFIYAVEAVNATYVEFGKSRGLNGTSDNNLATSGLKANTTIKVYIVSKDGTVTVVHDEVLVGTGVTANLDKFYPAPVYLKAGEKMYYEIFNPNTDLCDYIHLPVLKFATDSIASLDAGEDRGFVAGEEYEIPEVFAINSNGTQHPTSISVVNSEGEEISITDRKFTPALGEVYTITYTLDRGPRGVYTDSYTLTAIDLVFEIDDIAKQGFMGSSHIIPNAIRAENADGESYAVTLSVKDRLGSNVPVVTNADVNSFTPSAVGDYTVAYSVTVEDGGETYVITKAYTFTSVARPDDYDLSTGSYAVVNGTTVDNTIKLASTMREEGYDGLSALDGAVTFNLLRGTFDGDKDNLTKYDGTTIDNLDRKVASSLTADCWTSTNSFIYEVKANASIYVEIAKYLATTEQTIAYLRQGTTIKMYIVSVDGSVTEVYSATTPSDGNSPEKDAMYYPPAVYLQKGETLYYEINKTKNTNENDRKFQYLPVLKFASVSVES